MILLQIQAISHPYSHQKHPTDITVEDEVFLHIDLKQRGLGGLNSWGQYPFREYRLEDKEYTYTYTLSLF